MRALVSFIIFFISLCLIAKNSFACVVIDDDNQPIILTHPAKRIITLAPDLTEIVFALHAGENIIGTVNASDFPPAAKKIENIGSYAGLNIERIIALSPDLILTWGNTFNRQLTLLKKFHIPVYVNSPRHLKDVPTAIKKIACLLGKEKEANQLASQFLADINNLERSTTKKRVNVFYQIGDYAYYTVNKDTWIDDIIKICGGKNIFANLKLPSAEVTLESIMIANPEVILVSSKGANSVNEWSKRRTIKAVNNHRVFKISPDITERAGPRLIQGARKICTLLQ